MTDFLNSVKNVLVCINNNWSNLVIVVGLYLVISEKAKKYMAKSKDEKVAMAWDLLSVRMLGFVSDAEIKWGSDTGKIKRSEVINKVFEQYPILTEITDKEETLNKIDELIDEALEKMKMIFESKSINDAKENIEK